MVAGEGLKGFRQAAIAQRAVELILDLREVEALDAAGMGTLLRIRQWCDAQGMKLKLTNPNRHVREVLALTALDSVLDVRTETDDIRMLPQQWACAET